jgi:hypothetical protein
MQLIEGGHAVAIWTAGVVENLSHQHGW